MAELVGAGTRLRALGDALLGHGAAPENLGDIDAQSIAGATSTGTHGTGAALGGLAAQVTGLTLVTGVGDVVECSEKSDPDLLSAARVSLGALGVIVLVTLRVLPAYRLRYRSERMRLDEVIADLDGHLAEHRHFEFYAFPYSPLGAGEVAGPDRGAGPRPEASRVRERRGDGERGGVDALRGGPCGAAPLREDREGDGTRRRPVRRRRARA